MRQSSKGVADGRAVILLAFILFFSLISWGCDYGRMKDQEAIQTYGTQLPEMPGKTVPVTGGVQALREAPPERLRNPLRYTEETVRQGKTGYDNYCVMCHGVKADGNGTAGQSFFPLPTNLTIPYVQNQSDGRLFHTVTFGFKRHPGLGFIIAENDRWAIVNYVRSLKK